MKILKKILTIVLGIVVLVIAGGMIFLNNLKTRAVPDYNKEVDLENLTEKVNQSQLILLSYIENS